MAVFKAKDALAYHSEGRPGKIAVVPTKPHRTQYDLSLAYTPGVAEPCRAIHKRPDDAYLYTAKINLVAVISNGTAVLGLGDIGAIAGKPVMEGKGLLFKVFADIDVFDIEVDQKEVEDFVKTVQAIAPTFGGINLEDIRAPECFEIEKQLKENLDIPVFHDDQHGTAIISAAGLINALELVDKKIGDVKVVICGAGAAGTACAHQWVDMGVNKNNLTLYDIKGVLSTSRKDLHPKQREFTRDIQQLSLADLMVDADVFLGVSAGNLVTQEMLRSMAPNPVVFALANPVPEISYEDAMSSRDDIIFATGRSDYPNQINNVLGFPFIFRGALDVKARCINEEMKRAAVFAIADLSKQEVPEVVNTAYHAKNLVFGKEYLIPKPLDPRLITTISPAVAKAAIDSGVARQNIDNWEHYEIELMKRMGLYNQIINSIHIKANQEPKTILFGDADHYKVLKAVQVVRQENLAHPVLLGDRKRILQSARENSISLEGIPIVDNRNVKETSRKRHFAQMLTDKRSRKGMTFEEALEKMDSCTYFGLMMVEAGEVDGFLSGFATKYADVIRPTFQIIGSNNSLNHIAGMYVVMTRKGPFFFADTTVNIMPSGRVIADTTLLAANAVKKFNVEPRIAILSYSNFGTIREGSPARAQEAIQILHKEHPELKVDGEMQANFAFNKELRNKKFPFNKLTEEEVNTVIFPNLSSGNIAYKMMRELAGAEIMGPILLGIRKPVHVLSMESSVREIIDMAALTVVDAQLCNDEVVTL